MQIFCKADPSDKTMSAPRVNLCGEVSLDYTPLAFNKTMRPLKNGQFCSRSRKAKILTAGIHDKYFED